MQKIKLFSIRFARQCSDYLEKTPQNPSTFLFRLSKACVTMSVAILNPLWLETINFSPS